jgi:hypothetical protein
VSAFAAAHKHACSQTNDPKWNGSIVSDWQKGAAYAVAKVSITFLNPCPFLFLHAEVIGFYGDVTMVCSQANTSYLLYGQTIQRMIVANARKVHTFHTYFCAAGPCVFTV